MAHLVSGASGVYRCLDAGLDCRMAALLPDDGISRAGRMDERRQDFLFVGSGASLWTFFGFLAPQTTYDVRWLGLPLLLAGLAFYWRYLPRPTGRQMIMLAAIISAAGVPFLLPLVRERFFMLGDILAFLFAAAYPSRRTIILAAIVQACFGSSDAGVRLCPAALGCLGTLADGRRPARLLTRNRSARSRSFGRGSLRDASMSDGLIHGLATVDERPTSCQKIRSEPNAKNGAQTSPCWKLNAHAATGSADATCISTAAIIEFRLGRR